MEELKSKLQDVSIFDSPIYSDTFRDDMKKCAKKLSSIVEYEDDRFIDYSRVRKIDNCITKLGSMMIRIFKQGEKPESIMKYLNYIKELVEYKKPYRKIFREELEYYRFSDDEVIKKDNTGLDRFAYLKKLYNKLDSKLVKKPASRPVLEAETEVVVSDFTPKKFDASDNAQSKIAFDPMMIRRQMKQRSFGSDDPYDKLLESIMRISSV